MENQLQIYALRIPPDISHRQLEALFCQVTPARRVRAKKFLKQADTLKSLAAELLLCRFALPKIGLEIACPLFTHNEYGKPALANYPQIHFNLSHAGNLVVCAIDKFPVGIDVEEIQPVDLAIAQSFCTQEELSWLAASNEDDRLRHFYDLWTIKESYVKALGKGLAFPLDSFSVHQGVQGEITISPSRGKWFFRQYSIDAEYVLSVCASHDNFPRDVIWTELRELIKI